MSYIYLASPYSHPDERVRFARFIAVCKEAGMLIANGASIYSPIAHCHPIAMQSDLGWDLSAWREHNTAMLASAVALWVLRLPGWELSKGILWEMEYARDCNMPVTLHQPTIDYEALEKEIINGPSSKGSYRRDWEVLTSHSVRSDTESPD